MDNKVSKYQQTIQEWLNQLESGHPKREFAIISLMAVTRMELDGLRTVGTAGTSPDLPSIVSTFLKSLLQDDDPRIRTTVARETGEIAHDIVRYKISLFQDIPNLVEKGLVSALKDESPNVRKAATKALRKIGTPSALAAVPSKPWWKFW
jgi:hypothetical protein